MTNEAGTDLIHSGSLKLFERRKSRNSWTEYWVVLGGDSLRIFTSHESFLNASEEPMLIRLAADSSCESVNRNNRDFQFKIYAGDCFVFKCNTEHVRQEWLSKLQIILSNFCRKSCFHCSDVEHARVSIQSDSGLGDLSSQKPEDNLYNEPGEIIQNTSNTTSTNSSRNSTGGEDQITLNSPLKIYDSEQRVYSSFNKNENIKVESKTDAVTESTASKQGAFEGAMKNEKSPKNSFGYIFDGPDNADNVTPSSLKLFECEKKKRFSTFSKTSLKRKQPAKEFVNPNFVLDDEDFAADVPEIPKRISKVYDAPLNYDVPTLSKCNHSLGSLKVLIGKNNWRKYQGTIEKNILLLSDPELKGPEQTVCRIELKPNIKFTLLPRRSNDYRFKMTNGSAEYCFKTSNVRQRDSWIKVLTEATSSICQMACPRCCKMASESRPSFNESSTSQSDASDVVDGERIEDGNDDVFYVGMASPKEGIAFVNPLGEESRNVLYSAFEPEENEDQRSTFSRSGYLKTNVVNKNWEQYWATISGKQLVLHSSEENLNSLKTVELTRNSQCKTAKRNSYDFRFTLVASATECYEFKCTSAHDRREWMSALEKVAGGVAQNAGSNISEILTKIRENQSKLEEVQKQQQQEKERQEQLKQQQQQQQLLQQQQQQQQQQLQNAKVVSEDVYEVVPAEECQQQQQNIPSRPQQLPPKVPRQKQQQQQKQIVCSLPPAPQQAPPPTPPEKQQKQQEQGGKDSEDVYEVTDAENDEQQKQHFLPPPPVMLPPLTPPQRQRKKQQEAQSSDTGEDIHDDFAVNDTSLNLLPPPVPQQLPPLTPPQKRQQEQQKQQHQQPQDEDVDGQELYELIPGEKSQEVKEKAEDVEQELYEIIPADVEQQQQQPKQEKQQKQQQHKEKKNRVFFSGLQLKKQQKKDKKQKVETPEVVQLEQEGLKNETKHAQNQDYREQQQKRAETLNERAKQNKQDSLERDTNVVSDEGTKNNATWNFEEHCNVLKEMALKLNSTSSEDKDDGKLEDKSTNDDAENESDVICRGTEAITPEASMITEDVEKFLTQVLGKLSNLPDEVNKERLELSTRLQKFLKVPDKDLSKKKLPPPPPKEPAEEQVNKGEKSDVVAQDESDQGEEMYDDVQTQPSATDGEEMYDDVATQDGPEEDYEDVATKSQTETKAETPEPQEMYDDVSTATTPSSTKARSLSRMSNSSLDTKDVGEPKKASDIKDKIYDGFLDKYKTKGLFKKWQRRYCVLTPLALYYYENQKDKQQKGQIILPSSDSTVRNGCQNFPDVSAKDKKLCFELLNNDRCFLFKVAKETDLDIWITHIKAALQTDLSDEQSKLMRQKSFKISGHDEDDADDGEELYECIDTMQPTVGSTNGGDPEEMYELTDQFSQVKESSGSSAEAPALPSRNKAPSDEPPVSSAAEPEEEEFEEVDDLEDYQLPEVNASKPASTVQKALSGSPTLPARPTPTPDVPSLPPRVPKSQQPPDLPTRTTPPSAKKEPPVLPTRTTPTLTKKTSNPPEEKAEPIPPPTEEKRKPEVVPSPPAKPLKGEQFDYNRVYVAMWNCSSKDEDDLEFSRGNYLYIREKIPNSDWWVASLMDIPDIRVGLVPRNYIMPAYDM